MDDADLVREYQRHHEASCFEALVARHRGPVFRLILSLLGSGHEGEAEELTQDVFVKVYEKLDGFRGEAKFSSWLFRIAYNRAVDYRARLSFRAIHQSDEVLEMTPNDSAATDPYRLTVDSQAMSTLKDCMTRLPDLQRSVLHLHYWMGMTVAEVGKVLSIPDGTVKSHLHRARAALRALLHTKGVSNV